MHYFSHRDNELYCEDVAVAAIAKEVGTPFYLYSHATLKRHYEAFDRAFDGLDRVIHEKARLSILTSLISHPKGLAFNELKSLCALTDGNLSRHVGVLQEAGLVPGVHGGACGRIELGLLGEDLVELVAVRPRRERGVLGATELGGSHELHRAGDLLDVSDRPDAAPDLTLTGHVPS